MPTVVNVDGRMTDPEGAVISVFDRGFLFGDSVFETIRTYGGRPFALGEHLERLARSADLVFIELPIALDELRVEIEETLAAARNEESYLRVVITRGRGALGLDPALARGASRVIIVSPLAPPPSEHYERGIGVVSWRAYRDADAAGVKGAKLGNYLVSVLAMRAAKEAGADEAIVVDSSGAVVEGASSNVFIVRDGVVFTPPIDAGILAGITRKHLLECCAEQGIAVRLESMSMEQVLAADEVFVSSSIRELLPVVSVDGHRIGAGVPGAMTKRLLEQFRSRVRRVHSAAR